MPTRSPGRRRGSTCAWPSARRAIPRTNPNPGSNLWTSPRPARRRCATAPPCARRGEARHENADAHHPLGLPAGRHRRAGGQHLGLHRSVRVPADAHGRHGAAAIAALAGGAGLRVLAAAGRLRLRQAAPSDAAVTALPPPSKVKLGLVIDLDTCVGCHACATSCKEWNAGGIAGPLTDEKPYGKDPSGVWFNRVHSYELAGNDTGGTAQPA